MKKRVVILTGAGISAESGLKTFRDTEDGLWNGYDIEEVATPNGWWANPEKVLEFYNFRRREVLQAQPNQAHILLAKLEEQYDVVIITQNIDDLHERGGSTQVVHLHGEIFKMRSEKNHRLIEFTDSDIKLGDLAADGNQLRPHIVWFGEAVPMIETAAEITATADVFVIIGTSMQVYPAAGLLHYLRPGVPVYVIDKHLPEITYRHPVIEIEKPATEGLPILMEMLAKLD